MSNKPVETQTRRLPAVPDKKRSVRRGRRDRGIVLFFARFPAALGEQVRQIFCLSVNAGNKVLRRLFDDGLVRRHYPFLTGTHSFTAQPVYTLGPAAAEWVAESEGLTLKEARERCRGDRTPTYLAHALSIVDAYLAVKTAVSHRDDWALRDFLVEGGCRDELNLGTGKQVQRIVVRPDAAAVLRRVSDGLSLVFIIESDLHNVRAQAFAHKCESYKVYGESGAWREAYPSVSAFTILVMTGTDARADMLARTATDAGAGHLFRFATRGDIIRHGFFGPVWRDADGQSISLLPPEGSPSCVKGAPR